MMLLLVLAAACCCYGLHVDQHQQEEQHYIAAVVQAAPLPMTSAEESLQQYTQLSLARVRSLVNESMQTTVHHHRRPQIIVFPEALMWSVVGTRERMVIMSEEVPAVTNGLPKVVPCDDQHNAPILANVSCLAREYGVVIAFNLVTKVRCSKQRDPGCPDDGVYVYNTDVALGENGQLLARYHKHHIFGTRPMIDEATHVDVAYFDTSFGVRFGMFICFDLEWSGPAEQLAAVGVRDIAFSTFWYNTPPIMTATMMQQAWSRTFGSNILASNANSNFISSGGGIFSAGDVVVSFFNESQLYSETRVLYGAVPMHPHKKQEPHPPTAVAKAEEEQDDGDVTVSVLECGTADQPAKCAVFHPLAGRRMRLNLTDNYVSCSAVVSFSFVDSSDDSHYALMAQAGDYVFHNTPDILSTAACSLVHCPSQGCGGTFIATAGLESFDVTGKFKRREQHDPLVFPLVSTHKNARPVPFESYGVLSASLGEEDEWTMRVWSTDKWNTSAPVFAAGVLCNVNPALSG